MIKFIRQLIGSVIALCVLLYFIGYFDEPDVSYQKIEIASPKTERAFTETIAEYIKKSNNANNDLQIAALKTERNRKICQILNGSFSAVNWVGKVTRLSSNSDGKGVIHVEIAKGIVLKTWNNDFSDSGNNTLIDQNSVLFKKALNLKNGDLVKFSGSFIKNKTDCVREASLTQNGGMTEPEFIFKFSDISPI